MELNELRSSSELFRMIL